MKFPVFYTTTPSIGDLLCATPTIRKLAKVYKTKVIVVSPSPWLLKDNPYISQNIHIDDVSLSDLERDYDVHKSFHLLGKRDPLGIEFKHAICDIRQFHCKDLGFMLSPEELHCDYFPQNFDVCMGGIELPEKYIVIHPVQSWESRTWEQEKWVTLCDKFKEIGISVVSVGKDSGEYSEHLQQDKPVFKLPSVIDLTNKTSLDQTWHVINRAQCVITMDSGILHLAGTTDTQIIQLGSSIHPFFRAPYRKGSQSYKYLYVPGGCKIHCASDLTYSLRDWGNIQSVTLIHTCLENKPTFECKPSAEVVFEETVKILEATNLETPTSFFTNDVELDLSSFTSEEIKLEPPKILVGFRYGPEVEILGSPLDPRTFRVIFFDDRSGEIVHDSEIKINHWTKASRKYFTDWRVEVWSGKEKIHEEKMDLHNKEVLILFTSKALGDTIGWVAYADAFRKKHGCKLTLQCSQPQIFKESYPEIDFFPVDTFDMEDHRWYSSFLVEYGVLSDDQKVGMSTLNKNFQSGRGVLYQEMNLQDEHKNLRHPHLIPLLSICSDALGLEERELRTHIKNPKPEERPIPEKYICISEFASSPGMKEWNNKIGWEKLVEKLRSSGYKVVSISREKSNLKNVTKINGEVPLEDRIWYLHHCEFFVGLASGLAWLAWACGKKVVMISGFSMDWHEFQEDNIRIINKDGCHGCWNNPKHMNKFGLYHSSFCPENKSFECSRKISPNHVFEKISEAGLL